MSQTIALLARELREHAPFAQLPLAVAEGFASASTIRYFADGDLVMSPDTGAATELLWLKSGQITAERPASAALGQLIYEKGDLLPVSAVLAKRPVTATYRAKGDTFVLALPSAALTPLMAHHPAFTDWLNRRLGALLEMSARRVQQHMASLALATQSVESPLRQVVRGEPGFVDPSASVRSALHLMHERRIGSVLVGCEGQAEGILSRHDVLDRIVLSGVPLDAPVSSVMSSPVHTLSGEHTALDAALAMARYGIRHIPVTAEGRVMGVVSERDLFRLQSLSVGQLGVGLRSAKGLQELQSLSADVRRLATQLLAQGMQSHQLTLLISQLNDRLTERAVALVAEQHGIDPMSFCWLAFGSEGRCEQTLATDQDNGLVCEDVEQLRDLRQMAADVNRWLDQCGFPLCKGGIMAQNPQCARSSAQWVDAFSDWIDHGTPQHLLNASIFFDLRPLAGNSALAAPMTQIIAKQSAVTPRFLKLMADNALSRKVPLGWTGEIQTTSRDGEEGLDLKLQASAIVVDAARLLALGAGVSVTPTRERLKQAGSALQINESEMSSWVTAFDFIQGLRLRSQLSASSPADANWLDVGSLDAVDRRVLKESLRVAKQLQQRIELDYPR